MLEILKISERNRPLQEPCEKCGENAVSQTILEVNVGDPIALGVKRIPKDFKEGVLDKARKAIEQGAPRDKVIERLEQAGIDPGGL